MASSLKVLPTQVGGYTVAVHASIPLENIIVEGATITFVGQDGSMSFVSGSVNNDSHYALLVMSAQKIATILPQYLFSNGFALQEGQVLIMGRSGAQKPSSNAYAHKQPSSVGYKASASATNVQGSTVPKPEVPEGFQIPDETFMGRWVLVPADWVITVTPDKIDLGSRGTVVTLSGSAHNKTNYTIYSKGPYMTLTDGPAIGRGFNALGPWSIGLL